MRGLACVFLVVACGGDDGERTTLGTTPTTMTSATTNTPTSDGTGDDSDGDADADADASDSDATTDEPTTSSPTTDPSETGQPPTGMSCSYECTAAADCLAGGEDYGYTCQMGKCVVGCTVDDGCVAYYSGWLIQSCSASDECATGPCIVYEGGMGCGISPDLGSCADLGMEDGSRMTTEGDMQPVCIKPDAVCRDLGAGTECLVPCTDFVDCFMAQTGEVCTPDGECVYACASDADCPASNFDNVAASCG